ncbi:MAG: hypothetical protein ACKVU1_01205 [bacterium]
MLMTLNSRISSLALSLAAACWAATAAADSGGNALSNGAGSHNARGCEATAIAVMVAEPTVSKMAGPLNIVATYDTTVTPARQVVLDRAIAEWEAIVEESGSTPGTYPISFTFNSFGPGSTLIGNSSTTFNATSGNLISSAISFNTDVTWFVDPSPADDSEFNGGSPPAGFDLLTVARHEIGHALGWIVAPRTTNLTSGGAFDSPRLNIATVTVGGFHVDPSWLPNDLMVPATNQSTRRSISLYPTSSMSARAYGYRIPMQFIDPSNNGAQTGTANEPWRTIATALATSPIGLPLLLANLTHNVPVGYSTASFHVLDAARGGALVVAP